MKKCTCGDCKACDRNTIRNLRKDKESQRKAQWRKETLDNTKKSK